MSRQITFIGLSTLLAVSIGLAAQEAVDLAAIYQIKSEAFDRSQVMDHLYYLTDVHGPRLTNSPQYNAAAKWAVDRLKSYGVDNAHLEPWGRFGRGWSYSHLSVQLKEPIAMSLIGVPMAWCGGTRDAVSGEAILAPAFVEEEASYDLKKLNEQIAQFKQKYAGKLKGKIVLTHKARALKLPTTPSARRDDEAKLVEIATAPEPRPHKPITLPITELPSNPDERGDLFANAPSEALNDYFERLDRVMLTLHTFLKQEGALAAITTDDRGDGGIAFAESAGIAGDSANVPVPTIVLIPEHYNRLVRLVEHGVKVRLDVDLAVQFQDQSLDGNNIVAEIPGERKRDEVVMLGAHFDSWHSGTGATDNGIGSAVAMEAFRILKAINLPMDRTVRLALWGGEEQGLLGSRGYVKQHFGDPTTLTLKPEQAKIAAYFNLDNGSGKVRGVYLQGNEMVRPIFEQWLAPFRDLGATTLSIRNTGGTDHLSFDAVGIPAFQFIQDPLDYGSRTHHSHLDVYDRVQPGDAVQASAIMAAFVYEAAMRDPPLPRKPLPKAPRPPVSAGRQQ
jgi:carboxypeptidase Q